MNYMITIVVIVLAMNAVFSVLYSVTPSIENITANLLLTVIALLLLIPKKRDERYVQDYHYNYDRENPNALVTGENIAGTVFASYPDETPGLGWVL